MMVEPDNRIDPAVHDYAMPEHGKNRETPYAVEHSFAIFGSDARVAALQQSGARAGILVVVARAPWARWGRRYVRDAFPWLGIHIMSVESARAAQDRS